MGRMADHWIAEKFNWGDTELNRQAKSKKLGPMKPVWKSPSRELVEHAGKPRAGMLLKLAGKLPTGMPEDYLEAGWGVSKTH